MAGVQRVLKSYGYEFFHPSPVQIVARNFERKNFLIVVGEYEPEGRITMSIKKPVETPHDYQLMIGMDGLLTELSDPTLG
jgi:hypothetical protein